MLAVTLAVSIATNCDHLKHLTDYRFIRGLFIKAYRNIVEEMKQDETA